MAVINIGSLQNIARSGLEKQWKQSYNEYRPWVEIDRIKFKRDHVARAKKKALEPLMGPNHKLQVVGRTLVFYRKNEDYTVEVYGGEDTL